MRYYTLNEAVPIDILSALKFQILMNVRRIKIYVVVGNVQILLEHIDVYV